MMTSPVQLKQWRSTVVRILKRKNLLTDKCKIKDILKCGTVVTACNRKIVSGLCQWRFSALHHF